MARQVDERARDIRLHLFGTSNQSKGDRHRALPLAAELGLSGVVTESPGRLDYLDALAALTHASGILLLGSSEPHYTASKLYPALLARRPVLAVFHEKSSVVSILQSVGREPTIRVVTYDDGGILSADRIGAVARQLLVADSQRALRRERREPRSSGTGFRVVSGPAAGGRVQPGGGVTPIRLTVVLTHPIQYLRTMVPLHHRAGAGIGADRGARD